MLYSYRLSPVFVLWVEQAVEFQPSLSFGAAGVMFDQAPALSLDFTKSRGVPWRPEDFWGPRCVCCMAQVGAWAPGADEATKGNAKFGELPWERNPGHLSSICF